MNRQSEKLLLSIAGLVVTICFWGRVTALPTKNPLSASTQRKTGFPNTRFIVDDGYCGVSFTRPSFMELTELAEAGRIGTIIVNDHSRLGRNRLVVGQLLEEDFVCLGIRYIAIIDKTDTKDGLSDFLPVQDRFYEMHAKNTSKKVRAEFQNKSLSGKPLTTVIPYGYMKNEAEPAHWLIDEEAAEVVQFVQEQLDKSIEEQRKELAKKRQELAKSEKRIAEPDVLFQRIYEDNLAGKLSDERFATMSASYETEQKTIVPKTIP